ncbi:radical SAM family heme chaperone HemW [Helicobacter bilis]|uniref:radical SAM family heme chaperone HemW n=1 Tax=Helicobacter bilis TaxID=37372 RepID=UPI002557D7DE|nr:radical SAM family heme chaperone HemW [Helicobacter bilis]
MLLYIHIPFCDSKCGYCAFFSQINKENMIEPYFQALLKDIKHTLKHFSVKKITSIFVGGGTPNFVDSKHYREIFKLLTPLCASDCEITFEMNPNLITHSWLSEIKGLGANRLSIGVQSFYDDKLQMLERVHSYDDIFRAFDIAYKHIENISLDLIYDCKLDTNKRIEYELESALKLPISHLSAYSLSIDSNSRFGDRKAYSLQSRESFGVLVRDFLQKKGFRQYEVSNFSYKNKCRHNLGYWQGKSYLGVGASSVGRVDSVRYFATPNLEQYITNPLQRKEEALSQNDLDFESIFMGFRSEIGVEKSLLNQAKLKYVIESNLCYEANNRIYANDFFLADSIALYLT